MGVGWLGHTCGTCAFCARNEESLANAEFTGYQRDGGFADYAVAEAAFSFPIPGCLQRCRGGSPVVRRAHRISLAQDGGTRKEIGIYGFGAAAHIVAQVALWEGRSVYAFTRPGDTAAQDFAKSLGCCWAGGSDERPPVDLDAAIIFAPAGALVPAALRAVRKGGVVVCGGIDMSEFRLSLAYRPLVRALAWLRTSRGRLRAEFLALARKCR